MKRYYLCIKQIDGKIVSHVWHCTRSTVLKLESYDFIIPLERKPRNITEIHEG